MFASGSPFDPVDYNGQTFYPSQGNNSYVFPGIALAVTQFDIRHLPESFFLVSAKVRNRLHSAMYNLVTGLK